jgi:hypothetical protein
MKTKKLPENTKTFSDFTNKSWYKNEENITIGETFSKIQAGESETLEVKEIRFGEPYQTWLIVITKDDKIYLLKTSRELK